MKKFTIRLFTFLIPLLVSMYFVDRLISINLSKSKTYAEKEYPIWNEIIEGRINADIVINGNSRAWVQYNSTMIEDELGMITYNIGIDGHNFWLQYLRHQFLLKYNTKPKIILQSVDFTTLEKRSDLYNSEQFLPYMLWNDDIYKYTSPYKGFSYYDYKIPLVRYYGKNKAIQTVLHHIFDIHEKTDQRVKGYQPQEESWNNDLSLAKEKMDYYEVKNDHQTIELFDTYLKECKQNNIQIILIYPPELIDGQKFIRDRSTVIDIFEGFSNKYDIPFYDLSNDSMSYKQEYYYNSTHLNKLGAELFTSKIIDILKKELK